MEDKDPFILRNQYCDFCWPGVARNQGIRSHGIEKSSENVQVLATEELRLFAPSLGNEAT